MNVQNLTASEKLALYKTGIYPANLNFFVKGQLVYILNHHDRIYVSHTQPNKNRIFTCIADLETHFVRISKQEYETLINNCTSAVINVTWKK